MIYITIAEHQALMRKGLRGILANVSDMQVIGEARNDVELLSHIRTGQAHVLLLDLSMPGSGTELIESIRMSDPNLGILVLTMHDEARLAVTAMRAGANGFLNKRQTKDELIGAIKIVASGRQYISPAVADAMTGHPMPGDVSGRLEGLSPRELEVFSLLVAGKTVTATAAELGLSVKTASTHKARILLKMGMSNPAQLVQYALAHGLLGAQAGQPSGDVRPAFAQARPDDSTSYQLDK